MIKCPYCAGEIQDGAVRCEHCHSDLNIIDDLQMMNDERERTVPLTVQTAAQIRNDQKKKKKTWGIVSVLFIVIIGLLVFIFYMEFHSVQSKLVGEWRGIGRDTTWGFLFEPDGNAKPIRHGTVLDKSPYGMKLEWKINDNINPNQLDILTIYQKGDTDTWRMIFRFVDKNKIELCEGGVQSSRPEAFSKNNSHILVRR